MSNFVLITGGTKGIGESIAYTLAEAGYHLLLTYSSDPVRAEKTRETLMEKFSVEVHVINADITDQNSIDTLSDYIASNKIGKLKSVIFNAGITCRDSFEEMQPEEWERVFYANVHYPVFLLQRLLAYIQPGGCVLFTGSLMGIHPHSVSLMYGVTKSAVHALVKNLVKHLAPYHIRVNGVAPGFVDTEWQKNKPAEIRRNIENKIALERFCDPAELAEVYKMLIENSYMNGEIIVVDGGYSYK